MATYAGTWRPRLAKMIDATPPVIWTLPIEASQTIYAGDFVYRSSGYVVICTSAPTLVLGIAMEIAPTAAGTIEVLVATAQTLFFLPVHHDTASSADIEAADMGNATYDLDVVTSPYWHIDKSLSGASVTIHQFYDALGTVNGLVAASVNYDTREVK